MRTRTTNAAIQQHGGCVSAATPHNLSPARLRAHPLASRVIVDEPTPHQDAATATTLPAIGPVAPSEHADVFLQRLQSIPDALIPDEGSATSILLRGEALHGTDHRFQGKFTCESFGSTSLSLPVSLFSLNPTTWFWMLHCGYMQISSPIILFVAICRQESSYFCNLFRFAFSSMHDHGCSRRYFG
jgi:hypothetical protein